MQIETEWLRGYASSSLSDGCDVEYRPRALITSGITLTDLLCLFRTGTVVWADKLDRPGALWVVEGVDSEECWLSATIEVETQVLRVIVVSVTRVQIEPRPDNAA